MQFTNFLPIFAIATAAISAPTPQQGTENPGLKPFDVWNLNRNTTETADGKKIDTHFYIKDNNSGLLTVCDADDVAPMQPYPCNGLPQFIFDEDFSKLGIMWVWPEGETKYTGGNGTADLTWTCLPTDPDGLQQCITEMMSVPVEIAN